ncbi:MAG: long-chain fatty acid--CoA ligase [Cyclobacteriaceae bacterium]|nr:long-chain fatty acid--CoA ligase [Cyclobacteriaceae bacterium]
MNSIISKLIKNLSSHGRRQAATFKYTESDGWKSYTWTELQNLVMQVSKSLVSLGLKPQENVAIFSQNKVEWVIADMGIMGPGAVTVPIYATNTASQAKYIIDEAEIRIVFVGDQEQYDKILEIYQESGSKIEHIIVLSNKVAIQNEAAVSFNKFLELGKDIADQEIEQRMRNVAESDLATIIYTSGTTGEPKGVMLSHGNFNELFRIHDHRLQLSQKDHSMCFLPLSHVFERCWTLYMLYMGIKNTYLENPKEIVQTLQQVKPTLMCSVPRLYQKAYHTILAKAESGSPMKRRLFHKAIEVGKQVSRLKNSGKDIPIGLQTKAWFFDTLVFTKIRKAFGGKLRMMPTAGAPLSAEITEFFHALGMPLLIGYGLTETTATVSVFPDRGFTFGTVGVSMPEVQVKIGANDEILIKGKTIMQGYYKKQAETDKVLEDGWLKTGDAGKIDEHGNITITDRIKDLMKTAGGKYVAPQHIESILTNDNFIENAILIGDDKPYVSALLVPNMEALKEYAHSLSLSYHSMEELLNKSHIHEFYEKKLEQLQQGLANFEKVKKFRLLPNDFSMNLGELTPTLKIRRQIIISHFRDMIDDMYAL